MRILLLGGTREALVLAFRLKTQHQVIYSLAGATRSPATPPGLEVRVGGFGGAEGLSRFLTERQFDVIVDSTHPFAAQISLNARQMSVPVLRLERPAWSPQTGDRWTRVPHLKAALERLKHHKGPIALALGRGGEPLAKRLGKRAVLRRWQPDLRLDNLAHELAWLKSLRPAILVTKNSGGIAAAKLEAARQLKIPVMMIDRPRPTKGRRFDNIDALIAAIEAHTTTLTPTGASV